jgi:hypothetical protein
MTKPDHAGPDGPASLRIRFRDTSARLDTRTGRRYEPGLPADDSHSQPQVVDPGRIDRQAWALGGVVACRAAGGSEGPGSDRRARMPVTGRLAHGRRVILSRVPRGWLADADGSAAVIPEWARGHAGDTAAEAR